MTVPVEMMVQRPMAIEVLVVLDASFAASLEALSEVDVGGLRRVRSPRRTTSAWITVRPPRVMLAVPEMLALRETLLPES